MELCKVYLVAFAALLFCTSVAYSWGADGHFITCRLAQLRLSKAAADAVSELLPAYADNNLASLCSWPDQVRSRYPWSSALHYVNAPDNLCTYQYNRDCKDGDGIQDRCVAGAVKNYTKQLLSYGSGNSESQYNLTEALLFLSHIIGDIHQPLHVGFTTDRGGNTIDVHWYTSKTNLHHTVWAHQAKAWEACSPDVYATEGIKTACHWAYKGVNESSVLEDDYFLSRYPVVNMRLAQGGVHLAATLNHIFG